MKLTSWFAVAMLVLLCTGVTWGQQAATRVQKARIASELIAKDRGAWEAWRKKDLSYYLTLPADLERNIDGWSHDNNELLRAVQIQDLLWYEIRGLEVRFLAEDSALVTFAISYQFRQGRKVQVRHYRISSHYAPDANGKWALTHYAAKSER